MNEIEEYRKFPIDPITQSHYVLTNEYLPGESVSSNITTEAPQGITEQQRLPSQGSLLSRHEVPSSPLVAHDVQEGQTLSHKSPSRFEEIKQRLRGESPQKLGYNEKLG